MTGNASQFVGDIPSNYDTLLGPNIFADYAADMVRRARELQPSNVLELAAGTGIVSRKLRDALPTSARMVVTDLNAPMLDVARTKFNGDENVEFVTADAMKLDFPDGQFDLIACQFGVMFFPDKRASFKEALRVLRPGGTYLFNTWGTHGENPFARIALEVVAEFFPRDPPGFYHVPFSYADASVAGADLNAAGFNPVRHESVQLQKQVKNIAAFARGLVYGNPLIDEINARRSVDPDDVVHAIERRLREAWGPEPATMPLKANVFVAKRA